MQDEPDTDTPDELVHEALQERSKIAQYLRAVADGLDRGQLKLTSGDSTLELRAPTLCNFELRAKEERSRVKLRVRLTWRKKDENSGSELTIES
jgi:amphi-Trp domain-containing protein